MWYPLIRPFLFALDPESAHDLTLQALTTLHKMGGYQNPHPASAKPVQCFGLTFPNPIGLAAGLDKNAECIPAWQSLGFGFVEVGTVTPKAQPGNPKPRMFRLPKDQAIINRMGFNNKGVDYLIENLKKVQRTVPVGINIGKNKDTALADAPKDYITCFEKVYRYADYVTVNLSSPNTPGLRDLQHGDLLASILSPLTTDRVLLSDQFSKNVPILVKISPDMDKEQVQRLVDQLIQLGIDGVIATNTTIQHQQYLKQCQLKEEGGLSGAPLFEASTQVVRWIHEHAGSRLPIIAVGGISNAQQAKEKLAAGASLIQLYTGLIYQGPGLVKDIAKAL
jgi:dihydroorotate dehydrogenase